MIVFDETVLLLVSPQHHLFRRTQRDALDLDGRTKSMVLLGGVCGVLVLGSALLGESADQFGRWLGGWLGGWLGLVGWVWVGVWLLDRLSFVQ